MTAGELRKALTHVPDDTEVTICLPFNITPNNPADYMHEVAAAEFVLASAISNVEFCLTAGKGFGY